MNNFIAAALCLALTSHAQIRILAPASLKKQFATGGPLATNHGVIPASTATFGSPAYGESFVGRLLLIKSNSCAFDYAEQLRDQYNISAALGPSPHEGNSVRDVFLIPRGGCSFVKKVAVAEQAGADAVVIMDSPDSVWDRRQVMQVILADDGNGQRIRIPSLLVEKRDGEALASVTGSTPPLISMEWNLPQKDLVRADFWLSSGSSEALRFLKALAPAVKVLKGSVNFKPHFYILRMAASADNAEVISEMCYEGDPNLCALPPDVGTGLTAKDVLQENVRQLCLLKVTSEPVVVKDPDVLTGDVTYSQQWWDYVSKFAEACPMKPAEQKGDHRFNAQCSLDLMGSMGINPVAIADCIQDDAKGLLQTEKDNNAWSNLALRVNGARFSGTLEPHLALRAFCSAFETEPQECKEAFKLIDGTDYKPSGVIVIPSVSSGHSFAESMLMLMLISLVLVGIFYAYQIYTARGMRQALRQEVMLEVKSQLQDYYRVEDPAAPSLLSKETEFASLKFR